MALSVGTRLGHYSDTALLGEGGMGQVWRATDTQLNRHRDSSRIYGMAPDGRFLMLKPLAPDDDAATSQLIVILNCHQELLERVPVP